MKKNVLKKVVALTVATSICLPSTCLPVVAQAKTIPELHEMEVVMPRYIALVACTNKLTLGSGGKLNCQAGTEVQYDYMAEVIVELQLQDGNIWSTIKTWSSLKKGVVNLSEDWYVERGTYRLKLTHYAKTSSGSIADSTVKYSSTVTY